MSAAKKPKQKTAKRAAKAGKSDKATLAALDKVQAIIEFSPDGVILDANDNFLRAMGYARDEVVGKHHRIFVDSSYGASAEYREFWRRLNEGHFDAGEYKRVGKNGRDVWIQASYNPILNASGKPFKVIKFATDVTDQKLRNAGYEGQIDAISKSQAVIEFNLDGIITAVNDNFLRAVGYSREEVLGKHHSMFVEPSYANSSEYREFWRRLREGHYDSGEYKRIGKNGREVWISASYNPILDLNGRPFKVVKYATDITQQKLSNADYEGQIDAIGKSQAVIEFDMTGRILRANDNFLNALGYTADEVIGKHHSLFVEPGYGRSAEYRDFWQRLNEGKYDSGEYKRIGKNAQEVWIQASYNPILDLNGRPFKVVKYASDITQQKKGFLEMMNAVDALSKGDLTASINGEYKGDFAVLRDQFNSTFKTLSSLVRQISEASETINNAAADISQGNGDLNTRTQEQSSALEETASSLEELTATVKQNANNATQANDLASSARQAAESGGQVMSQTVGAMSAITEASKKVADIIGVIEQIAFQTNMLALNAAVEAARAGDQGRGFAVVAAEVRTLAQRSATAAKEIKALIQNSQEKVDQGSQLVNRSGETLQQIVLSVKQVGGIIGEIDSASNQQAQGLDQINSAVAQMDKNTQQNAAMVEQATAAAESMTDQARSLTELVRFFKVSSDRSASPATPDGWRGAPASQAAPSRGAQAAAPNGDTHAGKPMFSTRRPPPPQDEDDWKEF